MSNLEFVNTKTPTPARAWQNLSDDERVALVEKVLSEKATEAQGFVEVVDGKADGQIILNLLEPLGADKRGTFLLDLEELLKDEIDQGVVIWLSPLGDKNVLRKLRGIEVKS